MSEAEEPMSGSDSVEDESDEPLLSIENMSVEYGKESTVLEALPEGVKDRFGWVTDPLRAVDNVSLDVGSEEVVAIIGESGSGKTTLGKAAIGLERPSAGTVKYQGTDIWEAKAQTSVDGVFYEDIRKSLQIIHQDSGASLNPYRTIMTTLKRPLSRWYPEMSNADRRERIFSLFKRCGLTPAHEYEDRYPHELSGGEKQRVALIRAMLVQPDLILADEPVSALDGSLRIEILDLMLELQDMFGTSYIFVSHNLEHARYITKKAGGRIAIMYLGEIVEMGTPEEVIQNPKHPYTKILKWATLPKHPDKARKAVEEESPLRSLDIPDLENVPSGCRFHTRCPKAREACAGEVPDLYPEDEDHTAACFRELPNHEYWNSEWLDEDGEGEIPE